MSTFTLSVVTPEEAVLDVEASYVTLPAHDGEIGFLRNRAPLLVKLDVGVLRAETPDGQKLLYIDGGFAEMVDNRLTVLTEDAKETGAFDRAGADALLAEAAAMPATDDASTAARDRSMRRARVQRRLAGGGS